jgi:MFS family permease
LEAFAIYFVGFVGRPIGAFIFGHYGDRVGRKAALIATLLITGLATFAVGFVPGYDTIGIWGAVLMTIIRKSSMTTGLIGARPGRCSPARWPIFGTPGPRPASCRTA